VPQAPIPVLERSDHYLCDLWLTEEHRAGAGVVEKAVHRQEGFSGSGGGWEGAVPGKAAMQPPCEEDRFADGMIVRKTASVERCH